MTQEMPITVVYMTYNLNLEGLIEEGVEDMNIQSLTSLLDREY
jgi:hypothetical protein